MPDGTSALQPRSGASGSMHYMGCSAPSPTTPWCPRSPLAKIREDAPFDKSSATSAAASRPGVGAVINTREGRGGRQRGGVRPRGHRAQRGPGRAAWSAPSKIIGRRRQPEPDKALAEKLRHDPLHQPERVQVANLVHAPRRNSPTAAPTTASSAWAASIVMRQALECCAPRLGGVSMIIGVAEGGAGDPGRGRSSSSPGASLEGHGLRWRDAGRSDVPKIVDWYMDRAGSTSTTLSPTA